MSPGPWTRRLAALLALTALTAVAAGPARAAYQATVDSNVSAFSFDCINAHVSPPTRGSSLAATRAT
jgi:hypothetical protein